MVEKSRKKMSFNYLKQTNLSLFQSPLLVILSHILLFKSASKRGIPKFRSSRIQFELVRCCCDALIPDASSSSSLIDLIFFFGLVYEKATQKEKFIKKRKRKIGDTPE